MRGVKVRPPFVAAAALFAVMSMAAIAAALPQPGQRPPFIGVIEKLLDVVADPQPKMLQEFVDTHLADGYRQTEPREKLDARLKDLRSWLGRAELLNVSFERPGQRRAVVKSGIDGGIYILLFRVTDDATPKIAGLTVERGLPAAPSSSSAPVSAESRARTLLDLVFNASPDAAEKWLREAYTPELLNFVSLDQHLNVLGQMRDDAREIEIVSVTSPKPTQATVIYRSRLTGGWRELTLDIEPAAPNRITNVSPPRPIPPPPSHKPEPPPATLEAKRAALDEYARRLAAADMFSGSVLVAQGDKVIFREAYGAASREHAVPNTIETRLGIGSINKMFTAVGILQLVEQGKLSLKDPVAQHLPGVLPEDAASKIRIEHLLTHTSGLGDFLFTPQMQNRARANYRTIADYLPLLSDVRLAFEPGTRWSYSNAGFLVLGAILERVSGIPYDDYVQRNVFDRAGMTKSGPVETDLAPTGLGMAYQREYDRGRPRLRSDRYVRPVRVTPAGGGYSTPMDLLRFMTALRANKLLSPAMTQLMLTAKPDLGSRNYGFGAQIFTPDGKRIGHTGGGHGTSASVEYDASTDLTVIVLGNMNTGAQQVRVRAFEFMAPAR